MFLRFTAAWVFLLHVLLQPGYYLSLFYCSLLIFNLCSTAACLFLIYVLLQPGYYVLYILLLLRHF